MASGTQATALVATTGVFSELANRFVPCVNRQLVRLSVPSEAPRPLFIVANTLNWSAVTCSPTTSIQGTLPFNGYVTRLKSTLRKVTGRAQRSAPQSQFTNWQSSAVIPAQDPTPIQK